MGIKSRKLNSRTLKVNSQLNLDYEGTQRMTRVWGWLILIGTWTFFIVTVYTLFLSKLLVPYWDLQAYTSSELGWQRYIGNLLLWIQKDFHYCFLVPLTFPVIFFFVFLNWLGMKYFRHN